MIIYIFVFIISIFFVFLAEKSINNKLLFVFFSLVSILVPSLIAGLRDETVGTDIEIYIQEVLSNLQYGIIFDSATELTVAFVVFIGYYFSHTLFGVLFSLSFFSISVVYVAIFLLRKYVKMYYAMFIYLFLFYNESLNIMRQHVALSLSFLLLSLIIRKYYKTAIPICVLMLMSHNTAFFVLFPISVFCYLVHKKGVVDKCYYLSFVVLVLLIVGIDLFINISVSIGLITEKYLMYLSSEEERESGLPLSTLFLPVLCFVVFNFPRKNNMKRSVLSNTYLFFSYAIIVSRFASLITFWAARMGLYFNIFNVLLLPSMILYKHRSYRFYYRIILTGLVVFNWYWSIVVNNNNGTVPYKSSLLSSFL
ncbi:MAG: EpsG family protein [Paludibacteraceae bacterium]|nr:EpsG family protein [Paludibacteraceae bacterium]